MQERLHDVRAERRDHRDRHSVSNIKWPRSVEKCTILLTQFDDVCPSDAHRVGERARDGMLSVSRFAFANEKTSNAPFSVSPLRFSWAMRNKCVSALEVLTASTIEILQRQPFHS